MPTPKFNKAYLQKQVDRSLKTLTQIINRPSVSLGRVVPNEDNLPIHDGKRIDATVLFLDISNFSSRPAWTEQEQEILLRILSFFFTEMIRIVEDYGGVIEKNTGDGLMAYFVRTPDDTNSVQQRALEAALSMFYASSNIINPILERSGLEVINFRVCMDHGPITVAKIGSARQFNALVAVGTTANIAAKMLAIAPANTILLGTKVIEELPLSSRERFVKFKTSDTGWVYRETNTSYSFWEYTGRWREPIT